MQTEKKGQLIKHKITGCFITTGARFLSVGANVVYTLSSRCYKWKDLTFYLVMNVAASTMENS